LSAISMKICSLFIVDFYKRQELPVKSSNP
jgi:hypothetical protein